MSPMLIGVDVSLRSHHVQFMDGAGRSLASFSVPNDQSGADTLIHKMLDTASKEKLKHLHIGMEATSNLGWHLAHYLKSELQNYEPNVMSQVYVLNARKVARFKKGYDTLPKNDRIDAWVIADHLRFGRLPHEMKDIIQYEALQRCTRTRFHLMKNINGQDLFSKSGLFEVQRDASVQPVLKYVWQHQPGGNSGTGARPDHGNVHGRTHRIPTRQRQKPL